MSRAKTRQSTCLAKRTYEQRLDAEVILTMLQIQGKDSVPDRPLEVYRCNVCRKFHLGRRPATILDSDDDIRPGGPT